MSRRFVAYTKRLTLAYIMESKLAGANIRIRGQLNIARVASQLARLSLGHAGSSSFFEGWLIWSVCRSNVKIFKSGLVAWKIYKSENIEVKILVCSRSVRHSVESFWPTNEFLCFTENMTPGAWGWGVEAGEGGLGGVGGMGQVLGGGGSWGHSAPGQFVTQRSQQMQ